MVGYIYFIGKVILISCFVGINCLGLGYVRIGKIEGKCLVFFEIEMIGVVGRNRLVGRRICEINIVVIVI